MLISMDRYRYAQLFVLSFFARRDFSLLNCDKTPCIVRRVGLGLESHSIRCDVKNDVRRLLACDDAEHAQHEHRLHAARRLLLLSDSAVGRDELQAERDALQAVATADANANTTYVVNI